MISANFSEFRKNAAQLFNQVENGDTIRILRHGKPIADIVPVEENRLPSWKKEPPRIALSGASLADAILADRKDAKR